METKGSIVVIQSGGPTDSMNASLAGVIKAAKGKYEHVYGARYGISGLINDQLIELEKLSDAELERMKVTPASYLGSSKHRLPVEFLNQKFNIVGDYTPILSNVKKHNIKGIVIIGGNYSMDGVEKLAKFFKDINYDCNVIGAPKTVDNDLCESDHSPGYGCAIKYIATATEEIKLDNAMYEKGRVVILEVAGGDTGWLAAGSKLASINGLGPDLIYVAEQPFVMKTFLEDVKKKYDEEGRALVVVGDGIKGPNGNYIEKTYSYNYLNEISGHKQLGGVSTVLAQIVRETLGVNVRHIRLNALQRSASHCGSLTDINEAYETGVFAAKALEKNTGKVVSIKRRLVQNYEAYFELTDIEKVVDKTKYFPMEWIVNGNDISEEFIKYALPLIQGTPAIEYNNGLPVFLHK